MNFPSLSTGISQTLSIKEVVNNALNHKIKTIRQEVNEIGITNVHSAINVLIGQLVEFLNIGKNMTIPQINQTAELIISEKPYLSIEDLKICFKKIKSGEYGELYDVLDGHKLFTFLTRYEKERDQEAEHQSFLRHSKLKHGKGDEVIEMHPESKKVYTEIMERLNAKIELDKKEKLAKLGTSKPTAKMYDPVPNWLTKFDKLHLKCGYKPKPDESNVFKFIERFGMKLSFNDFITIKAKQHDRVMMYLAEKEAIKLRRNDKI